MRDEVRVTTLEREFPLERAADWIFYACKFYSHAEIVPLEQMGPSRNRRRRLFDLTLAAIDGPPEVAPTRFPALAFFGFMLHKKSQHFGP
jgi:hypothetical protein